MLMTFLNAFQRMYLREKNYAAEAVAVVMRFINCHEKLNLAKFLLYMHMCLFKTLKYSTDYYLSTYSGTLKCIINYSMFVQSLQGCASCDGVISLDIVYTPQSN